MSDRSRHFLEIPDDLQLVSTVAFAAAIGTSERKAKAVLAEDRIPIIKVGPRSGGIRLCDARAALKRREGAR